MSSLITLQSTASEVLHIKRQILSTDRSRPQVARKLYHLAMGIMCFTLYAFVLNRYAALLCLGVIGGALLICDILRLRNAAVNAVALRVFGRLMRREEMRSISGNSFYIMGLLVVVLFFSKPVALLATLYLAIGDPIAALVGTRWGYHKITPRKSLEGALANWFSTALVTVGFALVFLHLGFSAALLLGLTGGFISTLVELLPSPIDDNFTIPVASACLLALLI